MGRPRSEKSIKAEEYYRLGWKLVEIAKRLEVPEGTVRRWKSTQGWDKEEPERRTERSRKKKASGKNKKPNKGGAPKGNRNAVGGRGNPHPNTVKHGAYCGVFADLLTEDECNLLGGMSKDEEDLIVDEIMLYTVQERNVMRAIAKYQEEKQLIIDRVTSTKSTSPNGEEHTQTSTTTMNTDQMLARLRQELSTVQNKKNRAIDSLTKIRYDRRQADKADDNTLLEDWLAALMEEDEDGSA